MAANGYQMHILIGNLGADPKVNATRSGQKVTNFDIAVNERNADGREVVTWYSIAAWNGLGEACAQYLKKGRSVMVEGTRMRCHAWFGQDGNLYTRMELTANEVKFLGGNGSGNGNGYHNGNHNGNRSQVQRQGQRPTSPAQRPAHERPAQRQAHSRAPQPHSRAPQQHAPQAPTSQHEEEYVVPENPDEIPF